MKKSILMFLLFFIIINPCFAYELKASVSYDAESARQEAFKNISQSIDMSKYSEHFYDINHYSNFSNVKNGESNINFDDREVRIYRIKFGIKIGYSVIYKKNPCIAYTYYPDGSFQGISIRQSLKYPLTAKTYNQAGNLANVEFYPQKGEGYSYSNTGKLLSYSKTDGKCYNSKNRLVATYTDIK